MPRSQMRGICIGAICVTELVSKMSLMLHHRKLKSASGDSISLDQYRDQKAVVLFFYPKAGS